MISTQGFFFLVQHDSTRIVPPPVIKRRDPFFFRCFLSPLYPNQVTTPYFHFILVLTVPVYFLFFVSFLSHPLFACPGSPFPPFWCPRVPNFSFLLVDTYDVSSSCDLFKRLLPIGRAGVFSLYYTSLLRPADTFSPNGRLALPMGFAFSLTTFLLQFLFSEISLAPTPGVPRQ